MKYISCQCESMISEMTAKESVDEMAVKFKSLVENRV